MKRKSPRLLSTKRTLIPRSKGARDDVPPPSFFLFFKQLFYPLVERLALPFLILDLRVSLGFSLSSYPRLREIFLVNILKRKLVCYFASFFFSPSTCRLSPPRFPEDPSSPDHTRPSCREGLRFFLLFPRVSRSPGNGLGRTGVAAFSSPPSLRLWLSRLFFLFRQSSAFSRVIARSARPFFPLRHPDVLSFRRGQTSRWSSVIALACLFSSIVFLLKLETPMFSTARSPLLVVSSAS